MQRRNPRSVRRAPDPFAAKQRIPSPSALLHTQNAATALSYLKIYLNARAVTQSSRMRLFAARFQRGRTKR